jgi:peptide deformylase
MTMALRTILQLGDPRLREVAPPVKDPSIPEIAALVKDLADTLAHWRSTTGYGRGIAAPQLGVRQRVIFLQLPGEEPWPLVNPEIVERSEERIIVWDACLSFLSIFMQVERHRRITVRYQDLAGKRHEFRAGDDRNLSELLQHEIDHLDGILAVDRISDLKSLCTREEFEKRYRAASPYAVAPATS